MTDEKDVYTHLQYFHTQRRITWSFKVSIEDWHPERTMRAQLERITLEPARQRALEALNSLEQARESVIAAAGDVTKLDQALAQQEEIFTQLTSQKAQRSDGQTYAARTLVYEDCQRDLDIEAGQALLTTLDHPLTMLLESARWFTYHAAQLYEKAFKKAYQELVKKTGSPTIEFVDFWLWIQPLLFNPEKCLMEKLVPELQKRWAAVLALSQEQLGQQRVHYASSYLFPRVHAVFAAPHAGWPTACYHSPDILIAARDQDAIKQDDYQIVLGEFHIGGNALDNMGLALQHPEPTQLLQITACDLQKPRVIPILPREALSTRRTHPALTLPEDWRLVLGADLGTGSPKHILALHKLVVAIEQANDRLVVRTRDGEARFDMLEIFDGFLSMQAFDRFKWLVPGEHIPRITIDRFVVNRETWRLKPHTLSCITSKRVAERYIGIVRWALAQGLPRFLFMRTPLERKPYYIDLESPTYVDVLVKAVRQVQECGLPETFITFTEMLPDPEQVWLPDSQGNRYAHEIRLTAVDQKHYLRHMA